MVLSKNSPAMKYSQGAEPFTSLAISCNENEPQDSSFSFLNKLLPSDEG